MVSLETTELMQICYFLSNNNARESHSSRAKSGFKTERQCWRSRHYALRRYRKKLIKYLVSRLPSKAYFRERSHLSLKNENSFTEKIPTSINGNIVALCSSKLLEAPDNHLKLTRNEGNGTAQSTGV